MISLFKLRQERIPFALLLHAGLGLLFSLVKAPAFYWQVSVLSFGLFQIIQTRNRDNEAAAWAAYFAGMEVIVRMTGQYIFWEIGKYGVVILLVTGILISRRRFDPTYLFYFLLLLPSIFIADYQDWSQARDMLSFNLSGPLCLTMSAIYFHRQKISGNTIRVIIRAFTLPVITMLVYLSFSTVDFSSIEFDAHSNFKTSGGYGPNQVSMVLGFSVFMLIALRYYRQTFSGWVWLDYSLMFLLLFRALITFSRGGVLGVGLALIAFLLLNFFERFKARRTGRTIALYVIMGTGMFLLWDYTNKLTQNQLTVRYSAVQENKRGDQLTTGRLLLGQHDLTVFLEHPVLGIGPGKSKIENLELVGKEVATHTEWTRMLAEHGSFGVLSLMLLLIVPLIHSFSRTTQLRPLLLALFILAFFSTTHSAMRIAAISFVYSLSLIYPVNTVKAENKKVSAV